MLIKKIATPLYEDNKLTVYMLQMFVVFPGQNIEAYRHQLGSFGVSGDLALRKVSSLSGGQKSRVAFALLSMARYENISTFSSKKMITISQSENRLVLLLILLYNNLVDIDIVSDNAK